VGASESCVAAKVEIELVLRQVLIFVEPHSFFAAGSASPSSAALRSPLAQPADNCIMFESIVADG
jgi:hypothetical protein